MDVKTTFLHGNLEEKIYMKQPDGFLFEGKKAYVCRLRKSLYAMKDLGVAKQIIGIRII